MRNDLFIVFCIFSIAGLPVFRGLPDEKNWKKTQNQVVCLFISSYLQMMKLLKIQ